MPVDVSGWREFRVGDLFELERCKCSNATMLGDGDIPYVGATANNNGIIKYVSDISDGTWVSEGNCIVFICDGQGSNGYQVYMASNFIGSTTCKIGRIEGLNELRALFLISVLNLNRSRYGYGYMEKRNMTALSNEVIKLPVTPDGEPDWDYMEQYMKAVMDRQAHVIDSLTRISKEKHSVDVGAWCEFRVGDLFTAVRGKVGVLRNLNDGDTPVIAAAGYNHGIAGYYDVEAKYDNMLTVSCNGVGCGSVFWHSCPFNMNGDAMALVPKSFSVTENVGLFLASILNFVLTRKYSYAEKLSPDKIKNEVIRLPVTPSGEPDWSYMEQYMRTVMGRQSHVVRCLARLRG